jgi:hypothetical protein
MQLTNANFTEHAYGVELVSANVVNGDTFDFQFATPSALVNNVVPRVTVVKSPAADPPIEVVPTYGKGQQHPVWEEDEPVGY